MPKPFTFSHTRAMNPTGLTFGDQKHLVDDPILVVVEARSNQLPTLISCFLQDSSPTTNPGTPP